jgi:DNA-binding CsgD family transcriptional regulator
VSIESTGCQLRASPNNAGTNTSCMTQFCAHLRAIDGVNWLEPRLSMRRSFRDLEERIRTLPSDGSSPELAVEGFRDVLGADIWAVHRMEQTAEGYSPAFLEHAGWTAADVRRYRAALTEGPSRDVPFFYDPLRPAKNQRNRVVALHELAELVPHTVAVARRLLSHLNLQFSDQLRVIVCDGAELLGWFGGFRDTPFTRREARVLERLLPALRTSLLWRKRLADAAVARATLETAMNAIGAPAFLLRDDGAIAHANDAGRHLVGRRAASKEVAELARHGRAQTMTVRGSGIGAYELVLVRDDGDKLLEGASRAAAAWSLTRRQREVLAHVARGDANKVIAGKLGCAEVTIELHVTAILRKAKARGRGELIARVWSGEPDRT